MTGPQLVCPALVVTQTQRPGKGPAVTLPQQLLVCFPETLLQSSQQKRCAADSCLRCPQPSAWGQPSAFVAVVDLVLLLSED